MQIMFGRVPPEEMKYGDNFVVTESEQYYYNVEANSECFTIEDTCGRSVVLGLQDIQELMSALSILDIKSRPIVAAEYATIELDSDKVYTV